MRFGEGNFELIIDPSPSPRNLNALIPKITQSNLFHLSPEPNLIFAISSVNSFRSAMSMRFSSASVRLLRSCSTKQPLLRCVYPPSIRQFSSSRIWNGAFPQSCSRAQLHLANTKVYTEQHEWVHIDDGKIGTLSPVPKDN